MITGRYAVYDSAGAILRVVTCTQPVSLLQSGLGEAVVAIQSGMDDQTAYVDNGIVTAKSVLPITVDATQITADGIDTATVSSIPAGVSVTWPDGIVEEVTDGVVELSVDLPGTYTLRFSAIPYLDQEVTIEAVAAA